VEKLPRLKLISQTGRVGAHIDVEACTERGIAVAEGVGSPVAPAELTWALIMAAQRRIPQYLANLKQGAWQQSGLKTSALPPNFGLGQVLRGRTLGIWGYGPGPFLVLPFMPPLTVRDGIGTAVDGAMDPLSYVLPFIWTRLGMKIGNTINDRSLNLDLYQGFEETTVDLYSAVRNGYLQRRDNMIKGPAPY